MRSCGFLGDFRNNSTRIQPTLQEENKQISDENMLLESAELIREFSKANDPTPLFQRIASFNPENLNLLLRSDDLNIAFTNGITALLNETSDSDMFHSILELLCHDSVLEHLKNGHLPLFISDNIGKRSLAFDEFALSYFAHTKADNHLPSDVILSVLAKTKDSMIQEACFVLLKDSNFCDISMVNAVPDNFNCCCRLLLLCVMNGIDSSLVFSNPVFVRLFESVRTRPEPDIVSFLRILAAGKATSNDLISFCLESLFAFPSNPQIQQLVLPLLNDACDTNPDLATQKLLDFLFEIISTGTYDNRIRASIVINTISHTCHSLTLDYISQNLNCDILSPLFDYDSNDLHVVLLQLLHRVLSQVEDAERFFTIVGDLDKKIHVLAESEEQRISDAAAMVYRVIQIKRNLLS